MAETYPVETPAQRYDRDWKHVNDDRKVRTMDMQSTERQQRRYVDRVSQVSAQTPGDRDPHNDYPVDVNYDPNADVNVD